MAAATELATIAGIRAACRRWLCRELPTTESFIPVLRLRQFPGGAGTGSAS